MKLRMKAVQNIQKLLGVVLTSYTVAHICMLFLNAGPLNFNKPVLEKKTCGAFFQQRALSIRNLEVRSLPPRMRNDWEHIAAKFLLNLRFLRPLSVS
jgi:hypothetical protein